MWRPAGFENRPAESDHDGQMEIFPAFSPFLATAFDASKKRSQTPALA